MFKESTGFPDSSSRIKQLFTLVGNMYGKSEIIISFQKIEYLFTEMVNINHNFGETGCFQFQDNMFQHRTSAMGTRAFGIESVNGFSRLPKPAANIIAFISLLYSCFKRTFYILFTMHQFYFYSEFLIKVLRQMLGGINRTMLPSSAAKTNR